VNYTLLGNRSRCRGVRVRVVGRSPTVGPKSNRNGDGNGGRCNWDSVASISSSSVRGGGGSVGLQASTNGEGRALEVGERVRGTVETTVDGEDHSSATMAVGGVASLGTVDPDRVGLIYMLVLDKLKNGRVRRTFSTLTVKVGRLSV